MDLYIDTETGSYGVADELYILHVNEGADIGDLLDHLAESELAVIAKAFGSKAVSWY